MLRINEFNKSDDPRYEGFEEAALEHLDELYATALRYTKKEKDAEDLVQETFIKAFTNWDRFEKGTNCRAWLFTILKNTFINKYRRQKKEREILNSDDQRPIEQNFFSRDNTDFYDSPEKETMFKSFNPEIREAFESLSPEFRQVVLLADLNDFAYKEIAYILDCPVGTVMSRLFRGRKTMREKLAKMAYERGIIRDMEPFLHEESNRTRQSVRDDKYGKIKDADRADGDVDAAS